MAQAERIAIVGSGVAGLTAAHLLQRDYDITLFEKNSRLGGHSYTLYVPNGADAGLPLDIGFMVMNDRTYPLLEKLLDELGINTLGKAEMTFSYYHPERDFYYALNERLFHKILGQSTNEKTSAQQHLLSLLKDIVRFFRIANRDLKHGKLKGLTLAEYLKQAGFSQSLVEEYILPMAAGIWSTPADFMHEFPADAIMRFYNNHGIYSFDKPPQWHYIPQGAQAYIDALLSSFSGRILTNTAITAIQRDAERVTLTTHDQQQLPFDYVVCAAHADQSLALLADATPEEKRDLHAWHYQHNDTVVHTDSSLMPPQEAWASWNYRHMANSDADHPQVLMTYHLNPLQGHHDSAEQYFVTLNGTDWIDPEKILHRIDFTHPVYHHDSIEAQTRLKQRNGEKRTFFCGSYMGYGFHEDAVRSAVDVAHKLGVQW